MESALEEAAPMESDSDGYLILDEPVRVDVFIDDDRDNPESGLHVVF